MANRGRPRIFVTLAEKQKAYRDRKRQESALRNSSSDQPEQIHTELSEIEVLWRKEIEIQNERSALVHSFPTITEEQFPEWDRRVKDLADQWWVNRKAWYTLYREAGFPDGPWKAVPARAHGTL